MSSDKEKDQVKATVERQKKIYLDGMSGIKQKVNIRFDHLREQAKHHLSTEAFSYVASGAGREHTLQNNKLAFHKWAIVPRILDDISLRSTQIDLFNQKHDYPFMLAPVGALDLEHHTAEPAVARAAASEGITMTFSTMSSTPMEDVASEMGDARRWYQLYWGTRDELNHSFIKRAEKSGCSALLITVDTKIGGWRTSDLNLGYIPLFTASGLANYISDPIFQGIVDELSKTPSKAPKPKVNWTLIKNLIKLARSYPGNSITNFLTLRPVKAYSVFTQIFSQPALTWEDIIGLRKITNLPIIIKGLLHPDDAKLALKHGIDGIVVSNHGGRQLSSCIPTLEALPAIAEVIKGKIPILLDSGIRGGDDIFKAIALGANAVLIGRPYAYGLAIAGEEGVREVIQNLKAEFEITMALAGCRSIHEITKDKLQKLL